MTKWHVQMDQIIVCMLLQLSMPMFCQEPEFLSLLQSEHNTTINHTSLLIQLPAGGFSFIFMAAQS